MLSRLRFIGLYLIFWLLFFEVGRVIFLAYEWRSTSLLSPRLLFGIPRHGLKMDLAMACAFTLIPATVIARAGFIPAATTRRIVSAFTIGLLILISLAIAADVELFSLWGTRLDSAPLRYLVTPHEAWASARSSPLALLLIVACGLAAAGAGTFKKVVLPWHDHATSRDPLGSSVAFCVAVLLAIALGRFVPITQSSVYFSRNSFSNQAAINPAWNLIESLIVGDADTRGYRFTYESSAIRTTDSLLQRPIENQPAGALTPILLRRRLPNLILIIWEGLTAKVVSPLGGRAEITPNLTRLTREAILFDGLYASGFRTQVGLPAILSGFPSQPMAIVIESADKSAALPCLSRTLAEAGYHTGFFYGGDPDFANLKRYLIDCNYEQLIARNQFDKSERVSAWGVPDHLLFARVLHDFRILQRPSFVTILTLSSHEPFDVPMRTVVRGAQHEQRFLNSQVYADRAVGQFIALAKQQSWWDSTLIIITADHGNPEPSRPAQLASAPEQYRIPMLWLGGALAARDTVIRRVASQTDIAPTLLSQLGIPSADYRWGRDILAPGIRDFAYYAFPNGFGYVDGKGSYVFDNVSHSVLLHRGEVTPAATRAGRAFQQAAVKAYRDLGRVPHR